ncbi:thymidine kinase 2, mitochondrial-like [Ischnura elegans]|uniref:thymidine kinase 2, mitochondrial-like n=1 Tax=Ischnura elegans TaxID=197161 RepID=UPI001ED8AA08|nr:thymidine kinase 2, mitochondrial-like [Ischnura elegans]
MQVSYAVRKVFLPYFRAESQFIRMMCSQRVFSNGDFPPKQFRVSVDGNIASGKSSVLNIFKRYPGTITIQEPVEVWRNVSGHNLLELLYEDLSGRNFLFENYVQLCRLGLQAHKNSFEVQVIERSLQNNRFVFIEEAYKDNLLTGPEYAVLCKYYEWMTSNMDISLDLIVYLQCSPEVAYKRMINRGRSEEKYRIPLDYMQKVHGAYEKWLIEQKLQQGMPPVLVINAEKSLAEIEDECERILPVLLGKQILNKPLITMDMAIQEVEGYS